MLEFLPGSATAGDLRYLFDCVVLRSTVGGSSNCQSRLMLSSGSGEQMLSVKRDRSDLCIPIG